MFFGTARKKMTQISFSSSVVGRLPLYWPICPFRNYVLAVFILAPLSLAGLFLYSYFKNKHCLVNGLLFNVFILTFGIYLLVNLYRTEDIFSRRDFSCCISWLSIRFSFWFVWIDYFPLLEFNRRFTPRIPLIGQPVDIGFSYRFNDLVGIGFLFTCLTKLGQCFIYNFSGIAALFFCGFS